MDNYRAIPEGYMRIGEIAKKADISIRTLQYYDKEGLLKPSALSDGGFRLYTEKDMAKLAQILMMKELGFPLSEIKKRTNSLDTKDDVLDMLTEQIAHIHKKIEVLQESVAAIESLKDEIVLMETVDFKKYSVIFISLQIKNRHYWMIKHFDNDVLDQLAINMSKEDAMEFIAKINGLYERAAKLKASGVLPSSDIGQVIAKEFWEMMLDITNGDFELMEKIRSHADKIHASGERQNELYKETSDFIQPALDIYLGINKIIDEAAKLQREGIEPHSEIGQKIAKDFWEQMLRITGGNTNFIHEMNTTAEESQDENMIQANHLLEPALEIYLTKGEKYD